MVTIGESLQGELDQYADEKRQQLKIYLQSGQHKGLLTKVNIDETTKASTFAQLQDIKVSLKVDIAMIITDNDVLNRSDQSLLIDSEQQLLMRKHLANTDHFFFFSNNQIFILFSGEFRNSEKNNQESHYPIILGTALNKDWISQLSGEIGLPLTLSIDTPSYISISTLNTIPPSDQQLRDWVISENYLKLLNPLVLTGIQKLYTYKMPLHPVIGPEASLYVSINADRLSSRFVDLQITIALLALGAVVMAALLALFTAKKIVQPITKIAQYSGNIADGDYQDKLIVTSYSKEVSQLATAFREMQQGISQREKAIIYQSKHDPLTGLPNRSYAKELLEQKFQLNETFQAVIINLTDFRGINDVFGSDLGDHCLCEIAKRLSAFKGPCMRLTGGKFLWIPSYAVTEQDLICLQQRITVPVVSNGICIEVNMTMGLLDCPIDANNSETFFRRQAMLVESSKTKTSSVSRFELAFESQYLRRLEIITQLRVALETHQQQMTLVYQPIVDLSTQQTGKLEALLRWEHPSLGYIAPDEFIKVAEDAGLINLLTKWVINQAMQDAVWFAQKGFKLEISINVSVDDIMQASFVEEILERTEFYNLAPSSICLELTESLLAKNPTAVINNLNALQACGYIIAIDDFGTGYSSLSCLAEFPAKVLKIDKSFVMQMSKSEQNVLICKRIIQIAKDFELDVVAEGIEDQVSMEALIELGCEFGQGYLMCKPAGKQQLLAWLMKHE